MLTWSDLSRMYTAAISGVLQFVVHKASTAT